MARRLNPYQQLLWRDPTTAQVGLGSSSVVLSGVTPAQQRFIEALYYGFGQSQVEAIAAQVKLPANQAHELISQLEPALMEDSSPASERAEKTRAISPVEAMPELVRAGLLRNTDAPTLLAKRRGMVVHLDRLDKNGLLLAQVLGASGIGFIAVSDTDVVSLQDSGNDGYPRSLIGRERIVAAQLILDATGGSTRLVPRKTMKPRQLDRVCLAVAFGQQVIDPDKQRDWVGRGVPVMGICFDARGGSVTPVLEVTGNGCLRCEHLNRVERDPSWATLSSQLLTSELHWDDATSRAVVIGLAAQTALEYLDLKALGREGEIDFRTGRVYNCENASVLLVEHNRNPGCDCGESLESSQVA